MTDKAFTICLWFDTEGEAAANYYASIFADSKIGRITRYTEAGPGPAGPLSSCRRGPEVPVRPPWSCCRC